MKRFFRILSIALLCGALSAPVITAQRHGGANNGGRERTTTRSNGNSRSNGASRGGARPSSARPANNSNRGNGSGRPGVRPNNNDNKNHGINNGNNGHRPGNGTRPGNGFGNGNNNGHRPGNGIGNGNGNNGHRPGNGIGNGNHPGMGNGNNGHRPGHGNNNWGNDWNHGGNHRPGVGNHRPGASDRPIIGNRPHGPRPTHMAPPPRPYRPNMYRPHYRPAPPPRWRPARGIPAIRGILGITFGTGISLSLDYLYNSGYMVDGYSNDVVYLRNVNELNYIWTDAALYYGANGLDASRFYYATPYYDMTRYNAVYNNLVALYGAPVAVNGAGQLGATWFGGNQGYITLSFGASNVAGGALRYLTTLTFGL